MDSSVDYYEILGISPSADLEVIKAAYRVLAKKYHPDTSNTRGDTSASFKRLNEAYEVLSNALQRQEYDRRRNTRKHHRDTESGSYASPDDDLSLTDAQTWARAMELVSSVAIEFNYLSRLSTALASEFRTRLIRTGNYNTATHVSEQLQTAFFRETFGDKEDVQDAGRWCLENGRIDAARELSALGKTFGKSVDSETLVNTVIKKFNLHALKAERQSAAEEEERDRERSAKDQLEEAKLNKRRARELELERDRDIAFTFGGMFLVFFVGPFLLFGGYYIYELVQHYFAL